MIVTLQRIEAALQSRGSPFRRGAVVFDPQGPVRAVPLAALRGASRLLVLAACSWFGACGSTSSPPPTTGGGVPAGPVVPAPDTTAWGFFAYTGDLVGGLSNARWSRVTGNVWPDIEQPPGSGNYNWSVPDARVGFAQSAGLNVVFVLKAGNGSAFSEPGCFGAVQAASAADLPSGRALASCPIRTEMESAWSRMVTEFVERFDGDGNRDMPGLLGNVRVDIEVENEAANRQLWDYGEADRALAADRYLRLLDLAYQAKQAAHPETRVILAGLFEPNLLARCDGQPQGPGCTSLVLQNLAFSKRILGRPEIFDAVDVHFFVYYHFEPSFIDDGFDWVIGQMQGRGYQRPIYSLEWTGSMMLHVAEGYSAEFAAYFPYSAEFPSLQDFQAMYVGLDQPENAFYRQWFEAEQAKELGKLFTNILALGVSRLVHVQYSDYRPGAWDNPWWNWQGVIKYVGGGPVRKPSYYTYNILSERIFGFTAARRIEQGNDVRLYEFAFPTREPTHVLWTDGAEGVLDLSAAVSRPTLRLTHLVTELGATNEPIVRAEQTVPATAVPVGDVPVLLEGVQ